MKVMILAGGTGGHVFPGLAVANKFLSHGVEVEWLGTQRGIEAQLVPAAKIPLHFLNISGVRGKGLNHIFKAPFNIASAIFKTVRILKKAKPQLVIGFGGYVAGPGGIAAKLLGYPLVIHEQNAIAGTTNRLLSRLANRILTGFPDVFKKGQFVGNPVREEIIALRQNDNKRHDDLPLKVLVVGGSLGATVLNETVPQALARLDDRSQLQVVHQSGRQHIQQTQTAYDQLGVHAQIMPFIDDMAVQLSWADLVICRSGALTVSEISTAGVAALFVPFPFAIDDHQRANAQWLSDNEAALLCLQENFTPEYLTQMLTRFINDKLPLSHMAQRAQIMSEPQATQTIYTICMELVHEY